MEEPMKWFKAALLGTALAIGIAAPANAQMMADTLYQICDDETSAFNQGMCIGQVTGAINAFEYYDDVNFCAPDDLRARHVVDAFIVWCAAQDPEKLAAMQSTEAIARALAQAFPCD
jgi:hypothetical protein